MTREQMDHIIEILSDILAMDDTVTTTELEERAEHYASEFNYKLTKKDLEEIISKL